jgi:hypothetical protein
MPRSVSASRSLRRRRFKHNLVSAIDAASQELRFIIERWEAELREDRIMTRSTSIAAVLIAMSLGLPAYGQETGGNAAVVPAPFGNASGQPLNKDHLARTGKTLPHPGVSQAEGETDLDRSIRKQDERAEDSICKGC